MLHTTDIGVQQASLEGGPCLPTGRDVSPYNLMKPRIFLTRLLPQEVMRSLKRQFRLTFNTKDRPLTREEIIRGMGRADGLISMLSDPVDSRILETAPHLKIISSYAVGYNNIDIDAASARKVVVTNTPGVLTETVADLTWALMLSVSRRLGESEAMARSGKWTGWAPTHFLGGDVYGKTLGIIGMGRIAKAVARRAIGFSMKVLYYARHRIPQPEEKRFKVHYTSLSSLLKRSDFVSLHIPLTKETRHLIDRKALSLMKKKAYLINTARGPVVDEKALVRVLKNKGIAGAGFDVYEREPRVPASLRKLKNVVLLSHMGSASHETRIRMGHMVFDNLVAFFKEKRPPNQVNKL